MPIRSHKGDSSQLHIRIGKKKRRRKIHKLCGLLSSKILADSRIRSSQELEEAHTTSQEVQQHLNRDSNSNREVQHLSRDNNSSSRETSYQASILSDEYSSRRLLNNLILSMT